MSESKSKFREFIENFWYYNKYKVLVGILVLIVVINTVSQLRSRENPDITVDLVSQSADADLLGAQLLQLLSGAAEDINADGQAVADVNVYNYSISDAGELSFAEDDGVHLGAEINTGSVPLYIADDCAVMADTGLVQAGVWGDYPLLMSLSEEYAHYPVFILPGADGMYLDILAGR